MSDVNGNHTAVHPVAAAWRAPLEWTLALLAGLLIGCGLALAVPPDAIAASSVTEAAIGEHTTDEHHATASHGPAPVIAPWLVAPFVVLLGAIALMPFVHRHFWHQHYPAVSLLLGGLMIGYYLLGFRDPVYSHGMSYGAYSMLHTGIEYYSFIGLVGGLYVASAGVMVKIQGKAGPVLNTAILAFGAVLANIVGTTGASVLLIRPFLRLNEGRLHPIHVVFFIFIVSNCGGCLTPIGDPPLYLGFLKGVPFQWTILTLWPMWATCIGMLLVLFFVVDSRVPRVQLLTQTRTHTSIRGIAGMAGLTLIIAGVFIDPMLKRFAGIEGYPIGATFQIVVAAAAYALSPRANRKANGFTFEPIKEVSLLFAGIFATMTPALGFLSQHGASLGLDSPSAYYFMTGSLSAVLDNAPTYLNFMQVAFSSDGIELTPSGVPGFLGSPDGRGTLIAISLGAVFFGAMTYIGNGPNFMVKAIAESNGVRMPSFFGYLLRSCVLLLPILILVWAIFIR